VAVITIALLQAQAAERAQTRMHETQVRTGFDDLVVDVHRLLGRDVELVAQLTEVRDAYAQHARVADVDLARGAERKCRVREVDARELLQQSRERGPCTLSCAIPEVTSVTKAWASSGMFRFSHASTWRTIVSVTTTRKRSSASLVTVRSASSRPSALSHCV
jgi:hypothetical protein